MGRRMEAARPTLLSGHDPRRAAASFNRLALPRWTGSPVLNCPSQRCYRREGRPWMNSPRGS
jgi:hypothetical protein